MDISWMTVIVSIVLCIIIAQIVITTNLNIFINKVIKQEEILLKNVKDETLKIVKDKTTIDKFG